MIRYFTIKNKTKILILALYSWILPWGFPQQVKMKICIRDWCKVQYGCDSWLISEFPYYDLTNFMLTVELKMRTAGIVPVENVWH